MNLLVTNDDGIGSPFLHALVTALTEAGHRLAVVAPTAEQSWIGAAKSRRRSVPSRPVDQGFACPTWSVGGTPADCVNIALAHLLPGQDAGGAERFRPDAVVSGINAGRNASLGFILASGTLGGAWEGALHGLPAIAFSQDLTSEARERMGRSGGQVDAELQSILVISAARAADLVNEVVPTILPRSFTVHNFNFPYPCRPETPVHRTVPAQVVVSGLFSPAQDDGTHRFIFREGEDLSPEAPLTDRACLAAGHISCTVLDYRRLGAR